jgi:hypothetical protein
VLIGLGVVGALSIGPYALGIAVVLSIIGLLRPASRTTAALAIIPGTGVLPLIVALNNAGGPGERCWTAGTASGCNGLLDPWPFAIAGLVAVLGGSVLLWWFNRSSDA